MNDFKGVTGEFSHQARYRVGVLIANLGSPTAPTKKAVRKYLKQFLSDRRVIEINPYLWWLILNGIILNFRPKKVAKLYHEIWKGERAPLVETTKLQADLLSEKLGPNYLVEYAMRYGEPSIEGALERLRIQNINSLIVIPLFPQYSSSTSGSIFEEVNRILNTWRWVPEYRFVSTYHDRPSHILSLANLIRAHWQKNGRAEHLLFSFHGVPKRYLLNGDPYHCLCRKTARLVTEELGLVKEDFTISYQSRFGKEEWLRPYTDDVIKEFPKREIKNLDVICPGFVSDCLETTEEVDKEYRNLFFASGGTQYNYIKCLNASPEYIETLVEIIKESRDMGFEISAASLKEVKALSNG